MTAPTSKAARHPHASNAAGLKMPANVTPTMPATITAASALMA